MNFIYHFPHQKIECHNSTFSSTLKNECFKNFFFSEIVLSIHLLFFIYILFTAISFLFSNTKKNVPKKKILRFFQ